ncbi:hypothetical protein A3D80_00575 [Candidatus Roizmanbacteria bacterium RIFCSPHIGHO2_02_FULL_40_13b]|uniref:Aquaporin n=1 Tax=Candidatus Roizmanbacteria bacterium RIFCSPHIGHO2_01_FULL_39_24 TaxID=1802032 RepID=A0A1F7GKB8_9BACT|nr:MAG: hypothetical protein A2799_02540 [Candidatus Roizmanbacteria bacterium RIFCSPHIGHO2_01_FULL_39_24]OGK27442.1 MAG: hypothetical protein A3D80_00575 [Candidatus Roizmanbacteria bacterium RIFCSPHIGHO2_02_FULL_40_13b]OGK50413.1 MAG: hypothetical protein A3A56_02175 [Candidatus Roizmanbacteria bacterium RIFCSPLOWO2_01_FULL_40_32]OGK56515.1 MAG: hypothetical protein A3H83_01525 [Candidatus Roizmanbacteria bacterium RIFCSPLOWO2_02_FULL_39_8]
MANKKLLAEVIGTFSLTFILLLGANTTDFPIPIPILAGLILALFVYTIGSISGCHINPAVTVGLFSIKKIDSQEAIRYIVAQCIGGILAFIALKSLDIDIIGLNWMGLNAVMVGEIVGTVFFTFGIAATVLGKMPDMVKGVVIGGSLLLGASVASMIGAPGFLNPAVALGANSLAPSTIIGPLIGSVIGMKLYQFLTTS